LVILPLQLELEGIREKLNRGNAESIEIALMVVNRALKTIEDEPEEHLRKLREELGQLDSALGRLDCKLVESSDPEEDFYRVPREQWQHLLSLRENALALSQALASGQRTYSCGRCHRWLPIPESDLREDGNGRVSMRCVCGYEWQLQVIALNGDLRGEKALQLLPKKPFS
jgi:hypothetical protein